MMYCDLAKGSVIDVDALWASCHPLRWLPRAIEIVEQLNDMAFEKGETAMASFMGHGSFLVIQWGDMVLWDSEYVYRDDMEFEDDEGFEPTLNLCLAVLRNHVRDLRELFLIE